MMAILQLFLLIGVAVSMVMGEQKCTAERPGGPLMYKGKPCASTNRFFDYHKGACGCGDSDSDEQASWAHDDFTAGVNIHEFNEQKDETIWCGSRCGQCVKLTTTGGYIDEHGEPVDEDQSQVFMIVNVCPGEWPNEKLCGQNADNNNMNDYGYSTHFNLEDGAGQLKSIGWSDKNPEVTFEWLTSCEDAHYENYMVPDESYYSQCTCFEEEQQRQETERPLQPQFPWSWGSD